MKNILVVRFSSLGDIILTTGVIKHVKETLPDNINIDFLTTADFAGVISNYPYIRDIYCISKGSSLMELFNTLKQMPEYDAVIDLHVNLRSFFVRLINSAPSYKYNKNSFLRRFFVKTKLGRCFLKKHTVEKYFEPFRKYFNMDKTAVNNLRPFLLPNSDNYITPKINILIHPSASKNTKEWPFFPQLAEILQENGLSVAFIGSSSDDIDIGNSFIDLRGSTSLQKLIDVISSANMLITTDSGPMHIGVAVNTPTIAIFGPTTKELGFYPEFDNVKVIENVGLKCRPCHIHGSYECTEKHFKCMLDIGIEEVRYHVSKMLIEKGISL